MDPFSLSLSIIAASETAFGVVQFLTDKCSSYRHAPEEVLEIAHEINICRCLMTPFGERLKTASISYSADFQTSVEYLVRNSNETFQSIRRMIPDDGNLKKGSLRKWNFVLKKDEVMKHRMRVKQIQQMFLFMKEMMVEAGNANPKGSTDSNGTIKDVPITLTGSGKDNSGVAITYTATLIVQPTQPREPEMRARQDFMRSSISRDKRDLNILRQSPFFSRELLEESRDPSSRRRYSELSSAKKRRAHFEDDAMRRSSRSEEDSTSIVSEFEAARDVERLIAKWFRTDEDAGRSARRPSIVVPQSPASQPPTPISATKTSSPMKTSPIGDNSDSPRSPKLGDKSYSWSSNDSASFLCDSCSRGIEKPFYACSNCSDFHICKRCYDSPEVTLRMRHRHPTTRFVRRG